MSLSKTPLLSLGAKGSIGDTLTLQQRGDATLIRTKPTPTYRYTLLQAYQRWLYEDYAYLWRQQSGATRQEYATAGSRFHLTGFQYWMKYHLTNLPDIFAWYKLDERTGAIAHDTSRNAHHGVIIGASPVTGRINGAQSFDGLNDVITTPLLLPETGTLEYWLSPSNPNGTKVESFFSLSQPGPNNFYCFNWADGNSYWGPRTAVWIGYIFTALAFPSSPFLVHLSWDCPSQTASLYWNNTLMGTSVTVPPSFPYTISPHIGARNLSGVPDNFSDAIIDNLIVYTRQLDDADRARHLLRRYPP